MAGDIRKAVLNCLWLLACHSSHTRENCGESRSKSQSWDHFFFFLGTSSSYAWSALTTASGALTTALTCSISSSVVSSLDVELFEVELELDDDDGVDCLLEGPGTGEDGKSGEAGAGGEFGAGGCGEFGADGCGDGECGEGGKGPAGADGDADGEADWFSMPDDDDAQIQNVGVLDQAVDVEERYTCG